MKTRKMSTPLKELGSKPAAVEPVESVPAVILKPVENAGPSLSSILENGAGQQAEIAFLKKKLAESELKLKAFENKRLEGLEEGEIVEESSLVLGFLFGKSIRSGLCSFLVFTLFLPILLIP